MESTTNTTNTTMPNMDTEKMIMITGAITGTTS